VGESTDGIHQAERLRWRSKSFALKVVKIVRTLPRTQESRVISGQLLRSGTSVAANYRAVSRSRSTAEFISKIGVVIEETDESLFWLEVLSELNIAKGPGIDELLNEGEELLSIFVASQRTARRRVGYSQPPGSR
jgi:four helix bundle protein